MPGTREVKPTSPCAPGGSPVPNDVRLVAVVDGTPAVAGLLLGEQRGEVRRGVRVALAAARRPSPSTRKTTYDGGVGQDQPATAASPIEQPSAAATAGTTSPSDRCRYAGSTNPRVVGVTPPWVRADSDSANASSPPTASAPSAAAETRSEKSSEASTPV